MKKPDPIMNKWGVLRLDLDTLSNQHLRELYAGLLQEQSRVRDEIVRRQSEMMRKPGTKYGPAPKYDPAPKQYIPSTVRPTDTHLSGWWIAAIIVGTVILMLAPGIIAATLR